jgi:hypothetical protein
MADRCKLCSREFMTGEKKEHIFTVPDIGHHNRPTVCTKCACCIDCAMTQKGRWLPHIIQWCPQHVCMTCKVPLNADDTLHDVGSCACQVHDACWKKPDTRCLYHACAICGERMMDTKKYWSCGCLVHEECLIEHGLVAGTNCPRCKYALTEDEQQQLTKTNLLQWVGIGTKASSRSDLFTVAEISSQPFVELQCKGLTTDDLIMLKIKLVIILKGAITDLYGAKGSFTFAQMMTLGLAKKHMLNRSFVSLSELQMVCKVYNAEQDLRIAVGVSRWAKNEAARKLEAERRKEKFIPNEEYKPSRNQTSIRDFLGSVFDINARDLIVNRWQDVGELSSLGYTVDALLAEKMTKMDFISAKKTMQQWSLLDLERKHLDALQLTHLELSRNWKRYEFSCYRPNEPLYTEDELDVIYRVKIAPEVEKQPALPLPLPPPVVASKPTVAPPKQQAGSSRESWVTEVFIDDEADDNDDMLIVAPTDRKQNKTTITLPPQTRLPPPPKQTMRRVIKTPM